MSLLDTTQVTLESAMNGAMAQQSVLANNLANADTPGFEPSTINFQQQLEQALGQGQSPTAVQYTAVTQPQVTGADGNGVDSNVTNAQIAENGLLYQDLTQIAAAREGILQSAMNATSS